MRAPVGLLLCGLMLCLPTLTRADEVVYFTNGTYMHVLSHEVKGDMVRVRLDGDAAVAFPSRLIEKIEGTYGVVFTKPSSLQANQAAPSPQAANADTPYPVGVNPAIASRSSTPVGQPQRQPVNTGGTMGGEAQNHNYAEDTIMGSQRAGPSGSRTLGNKIVVDSGKRPGGRSTFTPSPFQAKPGMMGRPDSGLPSSPFPPPMNHNTQDPVATQRPTPIEEPPPEESEPESEGGP